jgi:2,6-dihydroxypyridine 3-monooxygenase
MVKDASRVVVMGGSLGGLTAALVLRDIGCDVHVFERSTAALEARGAGIAVLDDTIRYFRERDAFQVEKICSTTEWIRYLWPDGTTRYEESRHHRFSSWNTIYRALLRSFDSERYHLGAEVVRFEQDAESVTVRCADGSTHVCDLLVCADGITSAARSTRLPDVAPNYAGYVAWRGTLPEAALSARTFARLRDAITYQLLAHSHILVYPIPTQEGAVEPGARLMNFVWYRNVAAGAELDDLLTDRHGHRRSVSLPPGAARQRHIDGMRGYAAAHMAPPIAEVVVNAPHPFVQGIFDIDVPAMAFGRVCLIGDAAFAVRPHAAAGTAKAAANAWALGEAMRQADGDVPEALKLWEPSQLALGHRLLARTRDIGNSSQFTGSWTPGDPSLIFGLYAPGR